MKKLFSLLLAIMVSVTSTGCSTANTASSARAIHTARDVSYAALEDILAASSDIVLANYISETKNEDYRTLTFEITDTLRGTAKGTITAVEVFSYVYVDGTDIEYESGNSNYTLNENYMLALERKPMPFGGEDQYLIMQNLFVPLNALSESRVYGQALSLHTDMAVDEYFLDSVKALLAGLPAPLSQEETELPYIASSDMAEMLSLSGYVFQVQIAERIAEGRIAATETFRCDVLTTLKGEIDQESLAEGIFVTFPENLVETGGEYYLLLNRHHDTSRIYQVVSEHGVLGQDQQTDLQEFLAG